MCEKHLDQRNHSHHYDEQLACPAATLLGYGLLVNASGLGAQQQLRAEAATLIGEWGEHLYAES